MESSEINWNDKPEHFEYLSVFFDVAKAKALVASAPRTIVPFPLQGAALFLPLIKEKTIKEKIDISVPIIVATTDCGYLPIDGWHRIKKAIEEYGATKLPAVILSHEETKCLQGIKK